MRIGFIILLISCVTAAQTTKRITGKYSNPTLGYEVTIPEGLVGTTGDQAGPERGFTISLPSGGSLIVSGESNTLGWHSPMDGIRHSLGVEKCDAGRQQANRVWAHGQNHSDQRNSHLRRSAARDVAGFSSRRRSRLLDNAAYDNSKEG